MKYIRTKDGRVLESEINDNRKSLGYEPIPFINQADTIEDVCDEFVCDHNNGIRVIQFKEHKPQFPFCEDTIDYLKRNNQTFYGAIWTDKGLIYVAKMNDKGELELL